MWCYHMLCWKHLQTIKKISRRWTYHSAHYKFQQVAHFAAIGHFDEFAVEDCDIELIGLKTTLRYLGVNPFVGKLCQNFDWKTLNLSVRRMDIWTFGKGKFNSTRGSESGKKSKRPLEEISTNTLSKYCSFHMPWNAHLLWWHQNCIQDRKTYQERKNPANLQHCIHNTYPECWQSSSFVYFYESKGRKHSTQSIERRTMLCLSTFN